jgi:hypothetical protein
MKKIKLQLTTEQVMTLGDMLQYVVLRPETRQTMELEYYTLLEWYHWQASRFLFVTCKPLPMSYAEACALLRVSASGIRIRNYELGIRNDSGLRLRSSADCSSADADARFKVVATAIRWQLEPVFGSSKGINPLVNPLIEELGIKNQEL